ncbi:class I SAM-dependent methyltransferase [Phenylobacterium sp.]|uniref:class I SAM-dependent methyltransferase n=1 Tax=Phenylobacterium sp. TaxID=1871053 RepID=UPI0035B45254
MRHQHTFDTVAELYADVRPGYPHALIADLARTAGLLPGDRILEVGCGAGQATRDLAMLAGSVLALDPGGALIAQARRRVDGLGDVAFEAVSFENWTMRPGVFRLVASAQAWHWVDPNVAYERAAEALAPDGWLAIFGHVPLPPGPKFLGVFEAVFREVAPELWGRPTPETWYRPEGPIAGLVARSALFGPVLRRGYGWSQELDAAGYIALCGTKSYFNVLEPDRRARLFAALAQAIDERGGRIEVGYETWLHMAQKLD